MDRNQKIKALRDKLAELDARSGGAFSAGSKDLGGMMQTLLREEGNIVRSEIKERPVIKAIDKLSKDFEAYKKSLDIKKVIKAIEDADLQNAEKLTKTEEDFDNKISFLLEEIRSTEERGGEMTKAEVAKLVDKLAGFEADFVTEKTTASSTTALLQAEVARVTQELQRIGKVVGTPKDDTSFVRNIEDTKKAAEAARDAQEMVEDLRKTVLSRLNQIASRGGSMNRSIIVDSNPSTLGYYTDINLIASSNVSITTRKNDTTKYTEFVISATGGGGVVPLPISDGGTGVTSISAKTIWVANSADVLVEIAPSAGQSIRINAGNTAWEAYTPVATGGLTWSEVTGTSQSAAVNNGYIVNNAGLVTVTIPTTAALGDIVRVVGKGAGGWLIAQNASESINLGSLTTTVGTGGSLASTNRYDCVEIVCTVANTTWTVTNVQSAGLTVV